MTNARVARTLHSYAAAGVLDPRALERGLELAGVRPTGERWLGFVERTALAAGGLLLGAALIFFIAANWQEMTRVAKFLLVGSAVAVAALAGLAAGPDKLAGRAALLAATLFTGAMLAYVGQTYQTGADPWQLFAMWALLCLPWAIAANWAPLWSVELVVANVAVALYLGLDLRPWGILFHLPESVALAAVDAVLLAVAERWGPQGEARLLPRVAALAMLGAATGAMLQFIFSKAGVLNVATYALVMAGLYLAYRLRTVDVLVLAAGCLSVIVVAASSVGKAFITGRNEPAGYLFVALAVIGTSVASAHFLRGVSKEDERP
jgi:uncharacterized membrane protein